MKRKSSESDPEKPTTSGATVTGIPNQQSTSSAAATSMAHEKSQKRVGKRPGRKPSKIDQKAKLERSRQSARECRARKKLRYQYLEELVSSREKAVFSLREEVEMYKRWSVDLDRGIVPEGLLKLLAQEEIQQQKPSLPSSQHSPASHSSTPTASPSSSSVDTDHATAFPGAQPGRMPGGAAVSGDRGQFPGQGFHPQVDPSRRLALIRQPHVDLGEQPINKASRSFEDTPHSSSDIPSIYRSESVPNLTGRVASMQQHGGASGGAYPDSSPTSSTVVYKDFEEDSDTLRSTGFLPDLTILSKVISDAGDSVSVSVTNIPTVVSHQSPPATTNKPGAAAWTWEPHQRSVGSERTYPFTAVTSASSVLQGPAHSAQRASSTCARTSALTSTSALPMVPNFLVSCSSSVSGADSAPSPPVPSYYQRPRSRSDLVKKVTASPSATSTLSPMSSSLSLSQQNLPGLFDPVTVTTATTSFGGSQEVFPGLPSSVTTCLTHGTTLQDTAPVCMGSELSASISEPIPHWYSFLDDLESVASLSARQGAFSDASTPGSSRARSGAATPSSVDSPYSQQLVQPQPQQHQQHEGVESDGNIPHIISDLLGQPSSS